MQIENFQLRVATSVIEGKAQVAKVSEVEVVSPDFLT
jgi:hypothetical protein